MYNGWQGYGNTEGIRIDFMDENGNVSAKREREDDGADDQTFKQSRLMAGNGMAFGGQRGFQGAGQRSNDGAYDPLQPGLATTGDTQHGSQPGFHSVQTSQPANGFAQGPGFSGKPQFHSAPAPQSQNNVAASQPFHAPASGGFGIPPRDQSQQQRPLGQPQFGQQPGIQHNTPHQAAFQQQPPNQLNQGGFQQQQLPQQQQQNFGTQAYDPRLQANQGASQPPQQQPQPGQQLPGQLLPLQIATLADALAPLLQQSQNSGAPGHLPPNAVAQLTQQGGSGLVDQLQQHFAQAPQQFQGQPPPLQMQAPPMQQPPPLQQPLQMQQPQTQQPLQMQQPQMQGPPIQHPQGVMPKQDGFQQEQLPPDAVQTLYVDGMPLDITKRELAHIFRPFEGYKEIRVVEKKDKHGNPLVLSFVEFEMPIQANAALKVLQGYPIDAATPNEGNLRICFAKPFKPNDPRSRAPGGGPPGRMPPGQRQPGEGPRQWGEGPGGDRPGREVASPAQRGARDARDRRDRPGPGRRFSDRRPDERRPVTNDRRR